jgi:hypothetical protein
MSAHFRQPKAPHPVRPKALRSFWILVVVAVLAAGSLSSSLTATPSPTTGLRVAVSGLIALLAITLAIRVMMALGRARRS